jgi:hypothetical protein
MTATATPKKRYAENSLAILRTDRRLFIASSRFVGSLSEDSLQQAECRGCTAPPPVREVVKDPLTDGVLSVTKASFKAGEEIGVKYTAPVSSAGENQHWVTVIAVGKDDSDWGSWKMVGNQATADVLKAQTAPGAYEVRLHGGYPAKKFNVVARVNIKVEP